MNLFLKILLAITPGFIMVAIAIIAYYVLKRRNRRTKLKWKVDEMFTKEDEF